MKIWIIILITVILPILCFAGWYDLKKHRARGDDRPVRKILWEIVANTAPSIPRASDIRFSPRSIMILLFLIGLGVMIFEYLGGWGTIIFGLAISTFAFMVIRGAGVSTGVQYHGDSMVDSERATHRVQLGLAVSVLGGVFVILGFLSLYYGYGVNIFPRWY